MSVVLDLGKLRDETKYQKIIIPEGGALIQSTELRTPFRITSQDPSSRGLRYLVLEIFRAGQLSKYENRSEVQLGMSMKQWFSSSDFSEEEQEKIALEPMCLEIMDVDIRGTDVYAHVKVKIFDGTRVQERLYKIYANILRGGVWALLIGRPAP